MNTADKAKSLISIALDCDTKSIHDDAGLNKHPAWDSFGQLKILLALEEQYKIEINDEAIDTYRSYEAIKNLILQKLET